jgi:hypothetical protein
MIPCWPTSRAQARGCIGIAVPCERVLDLQAMAQGGKLNPSLLSAAADRCHLRIGTGEVARRHRGRGSGALDGNLDGVEEREWRAILCGKQQDRALDGGKPARCRFTGKLEFVLTATYPDARDKLAALT